MMTIEPGDQGTNVRGIGNYLFGLGVNGPGIRTYPYSTNFAVNPHTYRHTRTEFVPHGVGSVWTIMLWEATWELIADHGFDPDIYNENGTAGNQVMFQLVTEGMKLTPCSPGFVDARDAVLAADVSIYGGTHLSALWEAFARRGLGVNASQGSSNTNSDNTENFATPGVTLSLQPDNPPVVVARGDDVDFDATFTIAAGGPSSIEYWSEATLPGGQVRRVFGPATLNVVPGTSVTLQLAQTVPNNAPLGDYVYTMKVGDYPNTVVAADAFDATVVAAARRAEGEATDEWQLRDQQGNLLADGSVLDLRRAGEPAAGAPATASSAGLPEGPALHAPYPNPFAGRTTVRYEVSVAGPVRVAVYDVLGREVAVLAYGAHEPGQFTAVLDGQAFPAGVYLVRMSAPGFVQTQRVTLLQ
jgi:hypothetical protein